MIRKIAVVADISVGYGSPQIISIMQSLVKEFPSARGLLIEADQVVRPPIKRNQSNFDIKRIFTNSETHSNQWRIEYVRKVAKLLNEFKPDLIVYAGGLLVCKIHDYLTRPKPLSILYFLEMPELYHLNGAYRAILNNLQFYADIILHPEVNRMEACMHNFRSSYPPQYVVYNASSKPSTPQFISHEDLNGRILYQGTIDKELTFADYYLDLRVQKLPIDLYGLIEGKEPFKSSLMQDFAAMIYESRYLGYVRSDILAERRKYYSYGIISWNPVSENFRLAAPNKLFDYIESGVVPIAAPHPQCRYLIQKYKCGILLKNWSFDAFLDGLRYAMMIYKTPLYQQMRENCIKAAKEELNWDAQMKPVMQRLHEIIAQRSQV